MSMDSKDTIKAPNEKGKISFDTESNMIKDNNSKNEKRICILQFIEDNETKIKTGF